MSKIKPDATLDYIYFNRIGKVVFCYFGIGVGKWNEAWSEIVVGQITDSRFIPKTDCVSTSGTNQLGLGFPVDIKTDGRMIVYQKGVQNPGDDWIRGSVSYAVN